MKLIFKYFGSAVKKYKKEFAVSFLLILLLAALNTALPYALRVFLDYNTQLNNVAVLVIGLAVFTVFYLIITLVKAMWNRSLDGFGGMYMRSLTEKLMQSVSVASFKDLDGMKATDLKHTLYADMLNVFRVVGHHLPTVMGNFVVIVAALIFSVFYGWQIAIFILVSAVLGFAFSLLTRKIIAGAGKDENLKLKQVSGNVDSFIEALPLVQTNAVKHYYLKKSSDGITEFIKTAKRADGKIYFWTGTADAYYSVISIALSALLAMPLTGGSVVNLVFFTLLAGIVISQSQQAEQLIFQTLRLRVSFDNSEEILSLPPRQGDKPLSRIDGISFEDVSFSYGTETVLDGISFNLARNNTYRLIGENGSGKSTIIKLIAGLYPPCSGSVKINGDTVNAYSQADLNRQMLYIGQDEVFPDVTVREYAELIAGRALTENEFADISGKAGIDFDNKIEHGGLNLSGGQRKKLLFLKFLLRKDEASLIIIDEIIAGLDVQTAEQYITALSNEKGNDKIIIVVEHSELNIVFDETIRLKSL